METWCHSGVMDAELLANFPGYSIVRCDRDGRDGGGVCLFLRDDLTGEVLSTFDNSVCSLLVCRIHQLNSIVCIAYRPPNTKFKEFIDMLDSLDQTLEDLKRTDENVILMGDFNFPCTDVQLLQEENEGFLYPVVREHREGEDGGRVRAQADRLVNFALKYNLLQEVDKPTHGASILDLIWTSDAHLVSAVSVEGWPAFTDHKVVIAHSTYQLGRQNVEKETVHLLEIGKKMKQLDFHKADWCLVKKELADIDWLSMEKLEPSAALTMFFKLVLPVLEKTVPTKKISSRKRSRPIMDRRRRLLWKRLAKTKTRVQNASTIGQVMRLLQDKADLEEELRQDYEAVNNMEEDQAVLRIKDNPKAFFSFAKSRQKTRATIGPFLDPVTGRPNPSSDFAASELSKQYSSVFVQPRPAWAVPNAKIFFSEEPQIGIPSLTDIHFSEEDILKACAELKSSSAPGADGVPSALLKNCRKELKRPLYLLWRSSLDSGVIPTDLLLVLISPVHKGGSRGAAKNYRPVALTSHVVKVFERVIRQALVSHLESHGLLPSGQHGFRAMRSTLTQLLSYWDVLLDKLEEGGGVDAIYLDFSKAFDKVEHGVLLHKLREKGITGRVGVWIAAFLDSSSRKQSVVVDGRVSELSPVISGVPQGTVLGPILFLVHIADIAESLSAGTEASSFADDTRVVRGVKTVNDCSDLQADLGRIYEWAEHVNMHFNADKFECLRFCSKPSLLPEYQYLAPDSEEIKVKSNLRDLGVQVSSDLTFKSHIIKTVTAASRLVGWGMRTFRRRGPGLMRTLWQSLIQPSLDYCSQLWCPDDQESINMIEAVQRQFISKVSGFQELNHWEMLGKLHLYSQERRRERYMILFIWKISQGLVKGYEITFLESERRGIIAVSKPYIRTAPASIKRAREASLGVKGCKLFNILPDAVRNMKGSSVDRFKRELDTFLSTLPDQPTTAGLRNRL